VDEWQAVVRDLDESLRQWTKYGRAGWPDDAKLTVDAVREVLSRIVAAHGLALDSDGHEAVR
jgi:hypothetical protein